jgi:hypothetical protein
MKIQLDFGTFILEADLFDTVIANQFAAHLPYEVKLTGWGNELYGPIGIDLGSADPVAEIPPGGIAYTNQGSYVCIFFGQRPAWAVEYIGQISDNQWQQLVKNPAQHVKISLLPA